jgi:laccase
MYTIKAIPGKTYLLRIINAALNMEHFFTIANHKMTVVEVDGEYTKPFVTDHLMITPGQTTNVLLTADQQIGSYYMGMGPYMSARNIHFQTSPALALLQYQGSSNILRQKPVLPKFNDNELVQSFMNGLKSLADEENPVNVPQTIDRDLFFTVGLNVERCKSSNPQEDCKAPKGGVFAASMNNITFVRPTVSILQAYYYGLEGYFTKDFPDTPQTIFDFVNDAPNNFPEDTQSLRDTRLSVLEYGSNVQLIIQDTGTIGTENHPIHLHGFNFYVVASGVGNYDPTTAKLNLVDPPSRNTIGVPVGGWAAIRFTADNPGS